jgi:hypothetical protein
MITLRPVGMATLSSGTVKFLRQGNRKLNQDLDSILTYSIFKRNILVLIYPRR